MKKLTDEVSIEEIISELALEEKVKFLTTITASISYSVKERDIPALILADGATGVNGTHIILDFIGVMIAQLRSNQGEQKQQSVGNPFAGNPLVEMMKLIGEEEKTAFEKANGDSVKTAFMNFLKERRNDKGAFVSFPSGVNIGACFNENTAYRIGEAVGKELSAANVSMCLGPNVDIMRDPLGGRNYEMYGEDPVLVERTAASFIRGMQSTGTMACAKHFIANNQETNRQTKNTHVSTRTLRELYARGFRSAVMDGGVKSVMSAYNAVNGVFSSYNKMILTDWLKNEWGFEGIVVSDWGAVTGNNDQAIAAGMDIILHGFAPGDGLDIIDAVRKGTLNEARVDDAIVRILKAIIWQKKIKQTKDASYDQEAILKCAFDTLTDSMVLLKNDSILPLQKGVKAAFYGTRAKETMECGSGSTYVTTSLHSNLYDECKNIGISVFSEDMDSSDVVIYVAGAEGGENADRQSMELDRKDEEEITGVLQEAKKKGKKTVVVLNIAAPVDMRKWIGYADAILCEFVPGCMGGKATAAVLVGEAVPCGKLPMTFPVKLNDSPAWPFVIGEYNDIYYSEGIFNGYRWYDSKELAIQFPFGYGLSYTSFVCSEESVPESWDLRKDDTLQIRVRVKNIGSKYGAEVVQLYLGKQDARIPMPVKELMSYGKVYLNPGEEKTITLMVKKEDLTVFDPQKEQDLILIGKYNIMIGTDAHHMFYEGMLDVLGENPYVMDENTTMREIYENTAATKIVSIYLPELTGFSEEQKKLQAHEKIGPMLAKYLIRTMPDANQLKSYLDNMYLELAAL